MSSEGVTILQKSLCSHTFLLESRLFCVAEELRQFRQLKSPWCFDAISLNNAGNFLL